MRECATFGTVIAKMGHLYHWKLKVIEMKDECLNFGIIEANKCEECLKTGTPWYLRSYGYSYFGGNGNIYHRAKTNGSWPYGDKYGVDDIIDIWLDLRDKKINFHLQRMIRNMVKLLRY